MNEYLSTLKEKVVIITGGGRGIGEACAREFVAQGARVSLLARTKQQVESVAASINKSFPGHAISVVGDVSQEKSVQELFTKTLAEFGDVHILINNAAIGEIVDFQKIEVDYWDHIMASNIRGPFLCSREFFRELQKRKHGGTIINVSSLGGIQGTEKFLGFTPYVTSKFAVVGLTEALSIEGKNLGIQVNCIAPGAVDTEMLRKAAPFLKTKTTPKDIAKMIVDLCLRSESGLTGQTIPVYTNL